MAPWQLLVHGHRKSCDDHIRLMLLGGERPVALDQAETKLVAPVPTVAEGENFVTGLALDYSNQVGGGRGVHGCVCGAALASSVLLSPVGFVWLKRVGVVLMSSSVCWSLRQQQQLHNRPGIGHAGLEL